jgi:hypothetical protein
MDTDDKQNMSDYLTDVQEVTFEIRRQRGLIGLY